MTTRYIHRVLEHEVAHWVAQGWSVVGYDDNSPSLQAQGQRVVLLELAEDELVRAYEQSRGDR